LLKDLLLTLGATGTDVMPSRLGAQGPAGAARLPITVAGYKFDRFVDLANGSVEIDGCSTTFVEDRIGDMNTHAFSGPGTREVTEIGLRPFMLAYTNQRFRNYALLPIFPLRLFRHKSVFIRTDRGIHAPDDLRDRRIAAPGYSSCPAGLDSRDVAGRAASPRPTSNGW
jgi:4,5-dihydroxyphthalate decarboxylase